ncbi:MAG TPA: hypothetical protein VFB90_03690 [Dehalococcoidia bacterium]|nr:hypothetical protein [Dehalococcoidia bacterium]
MTVEIITRSRRVGAKLADFIVQETVILRDGVLVAALPEGDPLHYLLELSTPQLKAMRERLRPLFAKHTNLQSILEAILEYKRGAGIESAPAGQG